MRRPGSLFALVLALIALGALSFRLPSLGNRPMHGDEAVHAMKFHDLWKEGVYRYDPNEYHGPTIYYAELPVVWLKGIRSFNDAREADYRLPIVVLGAAMVLMLGLLWKALGPRSALVSALLLTISPAFVYYSRDYIQETPLALFTLGMLGFMWRYSYTLRPAWLCGGGLFAGLMIATKETAALTFVAGGLGLALTCLWTGRVEAVAIDLRRFWNAKWAAIAAAIALFTAALVLTNLFRNPSAIPDYVRSYAPWLGRAHGTNLHRHPWSYYLAILVWYRAGKGPVWSEGLIVGLAIIGGAASLLPHSRARLEGSLIFARFVTFATLVLTIAYSAIPYKTPWCVLNFLLGMILMAGFGAFVLLSRVPGRAMKGVAGVALLAAYAQLGYQSYRTSFVAATDEANPYVYAQPVSDVVELSKQMKRLSLAYREHDAMVVKILSGDNYYWPLPWYLRQFPNQGYYIGVPEDVQAPIVLADPDYDDALTKKLGDTHLMNHIYGLRPGRFFEIWIRMDVWTAYLEWKKMQPKPKEDSSGGEAAAPAP